MSWNSQIAMVLVNYHHQLFKTKNVWYYKVIFSSTAPMLSLKLILYERQRSCKFEYLYSSLVYSNIFTVALFIACQMTQCVALKMQCFRLQRNKGPSALLWTSYIRVSITFHKNQGLNIGNQYHKGATRPKKVVSFPEISRRKNFLSPTRPHKSNVYENIHLLFQKNTQKQK